VRVGEGFFTTERELKIIEIENEKTDQFITEMVRKMIRGGNEKKAESNNPSATSNASAEIDSASEKK
jgi:hypothetical protein